MDLKNHTERLYSSLKNVEVTALAAINSIWSGFSTATQKPTPMELHYIFRRAKNIPDFFSKQSFFKIIFIISKFQNLVECKNVSFNAIRMVFYCLYLHNFHFSFASRVCEDIWLQCIYLKTRQVSHGLILFPIAFLSGLIHRWAYAWVSLIKQ